MAIAISSPLPGASVPGFTSPTYTCVGDMAPNAAAGKQVAISAVGGTQVGVTSHTISSPFTLTVERPTTLRQVPVVGASGVLGSVPRNKFVVRTRKGVTPAANQQAQVMMIETIISVPAGSDTYDAANVKAAISAHLGLLAQQSSGLADTVLTAIL